MKIASLVLISFFLFSFAFADQKYNAFEDRWETTSRDAELKYNTFEDSWSYQKPNSKVEYNAYNDSWEWAEQDTHNCYYGHCN